MKQICYYFKKMCMVFVLLLFSTYTIAQVRTITGTVSDGQTKETLPGASVLVKGTTKGVSTDINGKYSLSISASENTLVVSFVGYEGAEIAIGAQNLINIELFPKKTTLDEVVVVGYGTSKVKDLTSAITTVKSEDLLKTPASQPMQALQGKVAGLQVISDGTPGSSSTIRVRGIGSYPGSENEAPLFVVDGMFYDNIDFLNPSDIASISVLKDASAAAIYGVRAANGVVLIETKSGSYNQKTQITYDGYTGYQMAANVLKMANAEQFATMAMESGSSAEQSFILNAMQRYGRSRINPNVPDVNTDWYAEILRPAMISNHSLSFDGGTEKAKYSLGVNYFYQEGIMKMKNDYGRLNLRTKVDIKATDWLTVGGNLIYSDALKYSDAGNSWNDAYFAVPIMPVYDNLNTDAWPEFYSDATDLGYRSGQNPLPSMDTYSNRQKIKKMLANFYIELNLIPKLLTFKSTYNNSITSVEERSVNLPFYSSNNFQNQTADLSKIFTLYNNRIWDNVATLTKSFSKHNFTLMAGTSYKDEGFQKLSGRAEVFPTDNEQSWYIGLSTTDLYDAASDDGSRLFGMSYFGRLAYNFDSKYLVYGTMRADGSSKYQQKWGYFPTVGVGWVVTEEDFLKGNDIVPFLKVRASWGQLGNDNIQESDGAFKTNVVNTALGGLSYSGTTVENTFVYLKWEVVEETNFGFTARFLKERLSADFDYYIRDTKNAAIPVTVPAIGGTVLKNVGVIRNSGIEIALGWTENITKEFGYNVNVNFSTLKNQVKDLYGQPYIDGGTAEFRQRSIVGEPVLAFYGYEVEGVYQTEDECIHDPLALDNGLQPGDLKFKDQNNDWKIDGDDRVVLGSYFPNIIYGATVGINYHGFDFSTNIYGQAGNKILNRKRGEIIWTSDGNVDADLAINRWHGEGTSDKYPSSSGLRRGWNQKMSNFYVEDGSFFRVQNLQVGYTLKNSSWLGGQFPVTRISFTADRPLSFFKYNGFTPEIANGWDTQTYPLPATYTIGLNVKF